MEQFFTMLTEDKQNKVPPITSFSEITINEIEYDSNEDIILPYGEYDIFIDFKGVSLKKARNGDLSICVGGAPK